MKMYVAVAASAASLSRPDEIARSINHREYVNDPRIYDDIQFNLVLVDIRDGLPSHQVEQIFIHLSQLWPLAGWVIFMRMLKDLFHTPIRLIDPSTWQRMDMSIFQPTMLKALD